MGRERTLAFILAGLFVLVSGSVIADSNSVSLDSEIINMPEQGWYGVGDVVEIDGVLRNTGDATSISIDPSCDSVLRIWQDNSLLIDGTDSCFGQNRGLDIGASASIDLETLSWDLRDSNGNYVAPGDYDIEYYVPNEELSSFNKIHVQTPIDVPDGVELEVIQTARDGVHKTNSPSMLTVRLYNSNSEPIILEQGDCKLNVNSELIGDCGPSELEAYEIVTIKQFTIVPELGNNHFNISLGDGLLNQEVIVNAVENQDITFDINEFPNLNPTLSYEGDEFFFELDNFESEILISNDGEDTVIVNFTSSCRAEFWVVDHKGNVVKDSREPNGCVDLDLQNVIPSSENRKVSQPKWSFTDQNSCIVAPGLLTVIGELPEMGKYTTETIYFDYDPSSSCQTQSIELISEVSDSEDFTISSIISSDEDIELTWFSQCDFDFTLMNLTTELYGSPLNCDDNINTTRRFNTLSIDDIKLNMETYEEGTYFIRLDSTSNPRFSAVSSFEYIKPIIDDSAGLEDIEEDESASRFVAGTWSFTSTSNGLCWFIDTPDEGVLTLNSAPGILDWSPERNKIGQYKVYESEPSLQCSDFSSPAIVIEEIMSEELPEIVEEQEEVVQEVEAPIESVEEEVSPVIVGVGVVVVSTGILSLLVAFVSTNEGLRIPATTAGLWLLGLIGKTSETSDGRYQRGRLMGYLTANPGCHFRALMAALEMSNGQITHHLKILEDEDRIWRKPDGRLVRFYPYTANLHPGLKEGELPMPPLSPDPNSLQGKILKLLDQDGTMNKYPTQVDLAHRLEKSQQLISHHLRTLENYGLVVKRRSGVKNRYGLTREALFLLESTEY